MVVAILHKQFCIGLMEYILLLIFQITVFGVINFSGLHVIIWDEVYSFWQEKVMIIIHKCMLISKQHNRRHK